MVSVLQRTRKAILDVFGTDIHRDPEIADRIIREATFTGRYDPGRWSPSAAVVIHCESGIPNGVYDHRVQEKWCEVSRLLGTHFCEHVNGAVISVHKG